jgi:PIN domain nuclease of toxin-antitoxin system
VTLSQASDCRYTCRHPSRPLGADRTRATYRRRTAHARYRVSCYVSAVSLWEIANLMALDRIAQDERLLVVPDGFELLPLLPDHCRSLVALPQRHRDPFDRMLVAQARAERLSLLTRDRAIIAYGAAGADVLTFDK